VSKNRPHTQQATGNQFLISLHKQEIFSQLHESSPQLFLYVRMFFAGFMST